MADQGMVTEQRRNNLKKAVFLDKDGTLIYDVPYNVNPQLIRFQDGAFQFLRTLQEEGYLLIVISNQAGVAKGLFKEPALQEVRRHLELELRANGIKLDGFYYCPHHPEGSVKGYSTVCRCRKPAPGMILQAAKDFNIDLNRSWMIGDILHDVEAGNTAGCRTVLLNNGNETEWDMEGLRHPTCIVNNLLTAAEIILVTDVDCIEHEQ